MGWKLGKSIFLRYYYRCGGLMHRMIAQIGKFQEPIRSAERKFPHRAKEKTSKECKNLADVEPSIEKKIENIKFATKRCKTQVATPQNTVYSGCGATLDPGAQQLTAYFKKKLDGTIKIDFVY
ncbi:1559_t:CDS:2 [Funneliformis geosporum]|uniref:16588_t:CDS:1 n=1 Tax=Funneliformis geosporum TaxID=1117311 RepID=A0A9W4SUM8_9GLOM|nr:16588_t:CDS:2 [Funneliformis geosporum]CAI2183391.1 1559_t:CDS:2 [Funneliformis geosporum]